MWPKRLIVNTRVERLDAETGLSVVKYVVESDEVDPVTTVDGLYVVTRKSRNGSTVIYIEG